MEYISWKKNDFQRYVWSLRSIKASFVLCVVLKNIKMST